MSTRVLSTQQIAKDLLSLTKPSLSALVLITAAGGMWLAPGAVPAALKWVTLLAIAGVVGAANTLNCYWERDSDRFMKRPDSAIVMRFSRSATSTLRRTRETRSSFEYCT